MYFKNRKQKRNVNEEMADLLIPLKRHCNEHIQNYIDITLRILSETEIEGEGAELVDVWLDSEGKRHEKKIKSMKR